MSENRLVQKVPGGTMIEDDGGFMNFVSDAPSFCPGNILGWGLDDDDFAPPMKDEVASTEAPPNNVISLCDYRAKRQKR